MMKVVGSGQALQDERRWVVKLECGHEVVVVSTSRPTSAECDQCRPSATQCRKRMRPRTDETKEG